MFTISRLEPQHWEQVMRIHEEGIATGNATFEQAAPSWSEWDASHVQSCRFIAMLENEIIAWAALSMVSGRCVYGGVAEVSVYVSGNSRGKGLGKIMLQKLIEESERNKFWTLQAGIFPENVASIKIHEQCGFRIVGKRERIGKMN